MTPLASDASPPAASRRDPTGPPPLDPMPVPAGLPRTAWVDLDLDALAANLATIRGVLPAGTRVHAVVKADAYGHGAVPVARALTAAGVDGLCVATLDEALELRRGRTGGRILVLYPIPPDRAVEALRRRIDLVAGDPVLLRRTLAALAAGDRASSGGTHSRPQLRLHLEVETGLGRGGVLPQDAAAAARVIRDDPHVRLAGVWTHLAAAADRLQTAFQVARFDEARGLVDESASRRPAGHLASSGAVLVGDVPPYEAVRVGLAMYGLVPEGLLGDDRDLPVVRDLRPVLSLRARPVRVAQLPAGTGISYGPSYVTSRPSRIATLPLGYADGFPRSLSNGADALVRGTRVPVVGTVAMDAIMVDVTDVAGPPVTIDDDFVLIGRQGTEEIQVAELARRRTTISYEVVAALPRRLPRVYYAAAGAIGIRTLTEERGSWRASNSGTGTSATSRSTRS